MTIKLYSSQLNKIESIMLRYGNSEVELEPAEVAVFNKNFHIEISDIEHKFKAMIATSNKNIEKALDLKQKLSMAFTDFWVSFNQYQTSSNSYKTNQTASNSYKSNQTQSKTDNIDIKQENKNKNTNSSKVNGKKNSILISNSYDPYLLVQLNCLYKALSDLLSESNNINEDVVNDFVDNFQSRQKLISRLNNLKNELKQLISSYTPVIYYANQYLISLSLGGVYLDNSNFSSKNTHIDNSLQNSLWFLDFSGEVSGVSDHIETMLKQVETIINKLSR